MKKRTLDAAQAKAKRQKKMAIAGGVLLVALLAFQLPGLLKKSEKAPEAPPATSAPATPNAATPAGASPLASASPEGAAKLPAEPDPAPVAQQGQLVSFNLFKSKDPFVQQLSATSESSATTSSGSPQTPPATKPSATTPTTTTPAEVPPATPPIETPPATTPPATEPPATEPPATEPPATEPPAAAPSSATISVNGISEDVQIGAAFPKANPLFRLLSIKDGVAKITIAGGSLQDGAESVPLTKTKPVTLMNTADGTKYVIKLISVS